MPLLHNYSEIDGIVFSDKKKIDWFLNGISHGEVIRQVHCGEIVSEFPYTLWSRRLGITSFKMSYKMLQLNFPRCHPTPT